MNKRVLVPVAGGSEEMEAVIIIDMLRRAAVDVVVAANAREVKCSRGVRILADALFGEIAGESFDMIVLPGGNDGTENLKNDPVLKDILLRHKGKYLAAICAAPVILDAHGLLEKNSMLTSHPSRKALLAGSYSYSEDPVVRDGLVITGRGAGTAFEFSLELISILAGGETAERIAKEIVFR